MDNSDNNIIRFPIAGSVQDIDDFRVVHASIDSQIQQRRVEEVEGNNITDFCNVTHEDWPSKENKRKKEIMFLWIRKKRDYILDHWKLALGILALIIVLILLFITTTLLLTLLPKKKSSIEVDNVTPHSSIHSSTLFPPTTTIIPDSSYGTGHVSSLESHTYQFDYFSNDIQSVIIDSRRNNSFLVYQNDRIIILNTINNSTKIINITLDDCDTCYIYDISNDCYITNNCTLNDVLYCCNNCNNNDINSLCSIYGIKDVQTGITEFKHGSMHHDVNNNKWMFNALFITDIYQRCGFQLKLYNFPSNEILSSGNKPCSNNSTTIINDSQLLDAGYYPGDDKLEYKLSITTTGSILISDLTGMRLEYIIHDFIEINNSTDTVINSGYDLSTDSFMIISTNQSHLSLIKFSPHNSKEQLYFLRDLHFEMSIGNLINNGILNGQLYQFYIENNKLSIVNFSFSWEDS